MIDEGFRDVHTGRWQSVFALLLALSTTAASVAAVVVSTAAAAPLQLDMQPSGEATGVSTEAGQSEDIAIGLTLPATISAGHTTRIGLAPSGSVPSSDEPRLLAIELRLVPNAEAVGSVYLENARTLERIASLHTVDVGITVHRATSCARSPGELHLEVKNLSGETINRTVEPAPPVECLNGPPPAPPSVHVLHPQCSDADGDSGLAEAAVTPAHCDRPPPRVRTAAEPQNEPLEEDDEDESDDEGDEAESDESGDGRAGQDNEPEDESPGDESDASDPNNDSEDGGEADDARENSPDGEEGAGDEDADRTGDGEADGSTVDAGQTNEEGDDGNSSAQAAEDTSSDDSGSNDSDNTANGSDSGDEGGDDSDEAADESDSDR